MDFNIFVAILSICAIFHRNQCLAKSKGHAVWDHLFLDNSYNNDVRPVKEWATPTVVDVSMAVIALIDFDEVKQTIILTAKMTLAWKDDYLVWNPYNFENITHIHVSQSKIWKPYIILENSVAKHFDMGSPSVQVVVHANGRVVWNPLEVFRYTCTADVRQFPFDTQKCSMIFETPTFSNELLIRSVEDRIDFHGKGVFSGWSVVETDMETATEEGEGTHITCSITLRRNPTYFILNIFLPIVILSFMNICVFVLPVQSGEKASFVITVFLSLVVFLTIVSNNLPEHSDKISILNVYVFMCTLLSVIIAIVTIIEIRIYHNDPEQPVNPLLLKLVLACSSRHSSTNVDQKGTGKDDVEDLKDLNIQNAVTMPLEKADAREDMKGTDNTNKTIVSWLDVTRVLDNIFLVLFTVINIIITVTIMKLAVTGDHATGEVEKHEAHSAH